MARIDTIGRSSQHAELGTRRSLAETSSYSQAQALVDSLSDKGFPVGRLRIVGTGLHSVEQITGRMTKGRAALLGAASGAWFGLLIGLIVGIFAAPFSWAWLVLGAVLLGAFWGLVVGFVGHLATGGRRDFASVSTLAADRYEVQVDAEFYEQALAQVPATA